VESYVDKKTDRWEVALRYSADLLNWSTRQRVIVSKRVAEFPLNYPVLCDVEGWSNTEIDINDFYVLGKGAEESFTTSFNKVHIYNPAMMKRKQ
jgi:hypothetical protein